jgi:hypothetical protein
VIFRRNRRFADLVRRQLDLFLDENGDLLRQCDDAEREYHRADRDDAEERYGDYHDLLDAGTALLAEMRDTFARTLDDEEADEYAAAFNSAVRKRLPRFALEIEDA